MIITDDMIEYRSLLGLHIKELREDQNLSQMQLGSITGLHPSYISRMEHGRCNATLDNIMLLANALGISLSELFEGIGIPRRTDGDPLPVALSIPSNMRRHGEKR